MDRDVSHVGSAARRARPLRLDSFGATRVTPDIRLQRWFDAPPDVVFDAYTDPDAQRVLRVGGADSVVESECDLRVGGEWIIRFGPASAPYVERNVFHTVERPRPSRLRVDHRVAGWIARRIADGDRLPMARRANAPHAHATRAPLRRHRARVHRRLERVPGRVRGQDPDTIRDVSGRRGEGGLRWARSRAKSRCRSTGSSRDRT